MQFLCNYHIIIALFLQAFFAIRNGILCFAQYFLFIFVRFSPFYSSMEKISLFAQLSILSCAYPLTFSHLSFTIKWKDLRRQLCS